MSPDEFYAHAIAAADEEGRLPLSRMTGWEVFPFEQDGLRVVPLAPPALPEPPRLGEGGRPCPGCSADPEVIWSDEHWRLKQLAGESGIPLVLVLESIAHHDLADLPDDRAAELGLLTVRIVRAIEALPHIARAHVSRWGDGGAHLHVFFFARPAGFPQLRGTCLALWDDLLPNVPADDRDRDAAAVAAALAVAPPVRLHNHAHRFVCCCGRVRRWGRSATWTAHDARREHDEGAAVVSGSDG